MARRAKAAPTADAQTTPKEDLPAKTGDEGAITPAQRWKQELEMAGKHFAEWQARGERVVRRYRDERDAKDQNARKFNLLWSNVQTLGPALYSKPPNVQVSRRFDDADKVGRIASEILERAVDYEIEKYDIGACLRPAVQDRLLPGWGIAWVRYEPHFQQAQDAFPLTSAADFAAGQGAEISDDYEYYDGEGKGYEGKVEDRDGVPHGFGEPYQEKAWECTPTDYVYWKDYLMSPARSWEEVRWVARRTFPSRAQLVKRFGEKGKDIPLSAKPQGFDDKERVGQELQRAEIWEVWDRESKKAIWVATGYDETCDERDDPLELECFFPCPKPLFATTTTGTLIPVPDYVEYQDQARELDEITERIASLTKSLKVVGVYDKSIPELQRMLNDGFENQMIPVDSWAAFAEKGGVKGSVDFLPIAMVIETVSALYNARAQVKSDCYEITGMADIVRGASDPNETATAQQIKGRYANLRLSDLQGDVERFTRELIRIKAEIMADHYSPQTLIEISGILGTPEFAQPPKELTQPPAPPPPPQLPPGAPPEAMQQAQMQAQQQAMAAQQAQAAALAKWNQDNQQLLAQAIALLKSEQYRDLRIDIETQSMIQMDEEADKQSRTEFIGAVSSFLQQAGPMIQQAPQAAPLMAELLRFAVRGYRAGREMEATIDRFIDAMEGQGMAPKQDPKAAAQQMDLAKQQMQVEGAQKLLPLQQNLAEAQIENKKLLAHNQIRDAGQAVLDQVDNLVSQHSRHVENLVEMTKQVGVAPPAVDQEIARSHAELMQRVDGLVKALMAQGGPAAFGPAAGPPVAPVQ